MPVTFQCSACGKHIRVADGTQGKVAKCPACSNRPAAEIAEPIAVRATPDTSPRRPRGQRWLLAVSLGWLGLLLVVPGLRATGFALATTVALLAVTSAFTTWDLFARHKVVGSLVLAQVGLFCLVHYQVYAVLGPDHYQCDRTPGPLDWCVFTGAHVLRAVDVLDLLDAYGIGLQNVKNASIVAGILLVWLHLVVDLSLLGLLVQWLFKLVERWQQRPDAATRRKPRTKNTGKVLQVVAGCLCLFAANIPVYYQISGAIGAASPDDQWSTTLWYMKHYALYGFEQCLRLVDVGDMFNIFEWQLHELPDGFWLSTYGLGLRALIAGAVGLMFARRLKRWWQAQG